MIVYSRFNSKRLPQFQLNTTMERRRDAYTVTKRAVCPEATAFLRNLVENYELLKQHDLPFELNKPYRSDPNAVSFEYVNGDSFEALLKNALIRQEKSLFLSLCDQYVEIVHSLPTTECVPPQEDFGTLFGAPSPVPVLCSTIGCLDINFDNLIISERRPTLIDYEWVFATPIPVQFIVFRALIGFYGNNKSLRPNRLVPLQELLSIHRFSETEVADYLRYESNFQKYVYGSHSVDQDQSKLLTELGTDPSLNSAVDRFIATNAYVLFLEKENALKQSWIMKLEQSFSAKDAWIAKIEGDNTQLRNSTIELSNIIKELQEQRISESPTKVYDPQLEPFKARLDSLERELGDKNNIISQLEQTVAEKSSWINSLQEDIKEISTALGKLREQLSTIDSFGE